MPRSAPNSYSSPVCTLRTATDTAPAGRARATAAIERSATLSGSAAGGAGDDAAAGTGVPGRCRVIIGVRDGDPLPGCPAPAPQPLSSIAAQRNAGPSLAAVMCGWLLGRVPASVSVGTVAA